LQRVAGPLASLDVVEHDDHRAVHGASLQLDAGGAVGQRQRELPPLGLVGARGETDEPAQLVAGLGQRAELVGRLQPEPATCPRVGVPDRQILTHHDSGGRHLVEGAGQHGQLAGPGLDELVEAFVVRCQVAPQPALAQLVADPQEQLGGVDRLLQEVGRAELEAA
jgi:hypothetical protein